ncbi:MAG: hypothetical protein JWM74_1281 [Myxococcaceae bacterium]|nr:hypothetical protein [Myxococcaceae bacterium]
MITSDEDFVRGELLYAKGEFWDAHEAWELLWNRETDAARRDLVQGLILVAAAIHKLIVMKRPDRAPGMIERAIEKLAPLPAAFEGIDVAAVREHAGAWGRGIAAAHAAGTLDLASLDRGTLPRVVRAGATEGH